ncbi:MAG: TIGR04086 family membrane protein, partial [Roseiflexaceae bacterium]
MNVRWMAVLTGFVVDVTISALLSLLATPQFYILPNPAEPGDLLLLGLLSLSTGIGGFVAGRMAGESRTMNGLLVAIVGILVNQLGPPLPRVLVISSV